MSPEGNIFHDERYYERPDEFIPERFLTHPYGIKPGVTDDPARRGNILFGAGRRVCPGIQLANTSIVCHKLNALTILTFLAGARSHEYPMGL